MRSAATPPSGSRPISIPDLDGRTTRNIGEARMPFFDRDEAGQRLAKTLRRYRRQRPVVLALPRGGVAVAAPIARALAAPLDLLIVRKIGVPGQPELAMGAIVDGAEPVVVHNQQVIATLGISDKEFGEVRDRELAEI